jgi:hypothetical protein
VRRGDHWGKSGVGVKVILNWIFEKWDGSMYWIDLAQDRSMWWAVVNAVMKFRVHKIRGNS